VPEGNNIISSVKSNPMQAVKLATKLDTAYESVTTLGGIAKGSVNTISALKKLMSAANISVKLPTSATEKAKPVDDKDME
jgi:ribosomal protein L10